MNARGFTLVEMLVAASIVAIFLMLAVPAVVVYLGNVRLRQVADEFRDGLLIARQEAISRNATVQFEMTSSGWRVVVPGTDDTPESVLRTRVSYSGEAQTAKSTSSTLVRFGGNGRVPAGDNAFNAQFTPVSGSCVTRGGEYQCLNVVVTTGGNVRLCDPAAAAGQPQAC